MSVRFLSLCICLSVFLQASCSDNKKENTQVRKPVKAYTGNRLPLVQTSFIPLPIGSVQANGWLNTQLQLQAGGLTGNLDKIWEDVGPSSGWLGGKGESWERGPYYLRGALALAYTSRNPQMLAKIKPWIEWTLKSQQADGFFGPASNKDWWPRMLMLQTLQLHYEATGDKRVLPFMQKFFAYQTQTLPVQPLKGWASARGGENLLSIHWLYNHTGDSSLLSLANLVNQQTVDWSSLFTIDRPVHTWAGLDTTKWWEESPQHTVNFSHGFKQPALLFQQTGDKRYWDATNNGLLLNDRYHGQLFGVHAGDERLGYATSTKGSELCEIVEYMHSLESILSVFGDPLVADRLENVAYNALPASVSPDWKSHCYYTAPNVAHISRGKRHFTADHEDDLTFGVLAGFPCCAVNMHMGWPLLTKHLWMATAQKGIAAMVYAPSQVRAKVADSVWVSIKEETSYPFSDKITFYVNPASTVSFPLHLRIPGWCASPQITVNGEKGPKAQAGKFAIINKVWKAGDKVEMFLPMEIKLSRWENNSLGLERGPLVYTLPIKEDWQAHADWRRNNVVDDFPSYEILPKSAWNYGLVADTTHLAESFSVITHSPVPAQPWSPETVPVYIMAKAKKIPAWQLDAVNNTTPVPKSPVSVQTQLETIKLIPFGATRLRITYLPLVKESKQ